MVAEHFGRDVATVFFPDGEQERECALTVGLGSRLEKFYDGFMIAARVDEHFGDCAGIDTERCGELACTVGRAESVGVGFAYGVLESFATVVLGHSFFGR